MTYSETLWARVDRTGFYRTQFYMTQDEAGLYRPIALDADWDLVRVRITEIRKSRSKGGKAKGRKQ